MTAVPALVWVTVGLILLGVAWFTGSMLDAISDRACNPTVTIVESTGLVIRDHPSAACD